MNRRAVVSVLVAAVALGAVTGRAMRDAGVVVLREPAGPALSADVRWPLDQLRLPAAWDVTTGSTPGPLIAVIDTGVHVTPDLAGRVESESLVGGTPGVDPNGHGTAVAGIAAASGADGAGLVGVCWSCRILSLQISTDGNVDADDVAKAVDRAVARGASVINLSLGADLHTNAERAAIARAVKAGAIVVAAAGNDGSLLPKFPAAYQGVLAVGAAQKSGKPYDFSNRGSWVGVMAPGCGSALDTRDRVGAAFCGTSAAAPFVSGVAGLLKSVVPTARGQDVIAAIQSSARPAAGSAHGIVDAAAAIAAIQKIKPGSTGKTKGALLHIVRRPLISGAGAVGAQLAASPGAWSGPLTTIRMRWERCTRTGRSCTTVSARQTYRVMRADRGKAVRVVVAATGEDGVAVEAASHLLRIR